MCVLLCRNVHVYTGVLEYKWNEEVCDIDIIHMCIHLHIRIYVEPTSHVCG